MSFLLEIKKLKRTGFFPAFLIGAILAASFPIINIAVRPENFINQNLPALDILMNANWQMISMLNMFFLVIGSCIISTQNLLTMPCRKWRHYLSQ